MLDGIGRVGPLFQGLFYLKFFKSEATKVRSDYMHT